MENAFTNDKDLKFLYDCPNDRLKLLVDVIIYDKDGKPRISETLSDNKIFRENYPGNIKAMLPEVINELQHFGGNSISNAVRGHGVSYREILEDVCKQQKVSYNKGISTELLEKFMLQKILLTAVDKMTEENIELLTGDVTMTKELLIQAIGFSQPDNPLVIKVLTAVIANVAGAPKVEALGVFAGIFGAGALINVLAVPIVGGLAGPIVGGLAAAIPAYRVTIPATIMIAYLRLIASKADEELEQILADKPNSPNQTVEKE